MSQTLTAPLMIHPDKQLLVDHPDLERLAKQLSLLYAHDHVVTQAHLQQVGAALWQALQIDEKFAQEKQRAGLHILPVVIATDEPALFSLPWECLYHPTDGFLAKHPRYTVSRQWQSRSLTTGVPTGPLQVLLFTTQPDDLAAESARLDTETEQVKVLEALGNAENAGKVRLTILDDGRFETLKKVLRNQAFHLVFLSGHGKFEAEAFRDAPAEASFLFEAENGLSESHRGQEIAQLFFGTAVQCVVLSACQSGKMSSDDLNASLTTQFAQAGVPHVIGMRESVADVAGIVFAAQFCEAVVQQRPVEVAVQWAREKISATDIAGTLREVGIQVDESYGQWTLPHLISQQPLRPLIEWQFIPPERKMGVLLTESLQNIKLPKLFIGRRKELRELGQLHPKIKYLLITGAGGQGKTALAGQLVKKLQAQGYLVVAYSARPQDADWQTFLFTASQHLSPALIERLDQQSARCKTPEHEAQLYLSLLLQQSQQKLVLFFDNLESVQRENGELTDENVQAWLTVAQRLQTPLILLTSRWCLPGWQAPQHHVLRRPSYGDFLRYLQELNEKRGKNPQNALRQDSELRRVLYRKLGGNFKGLELYHAAELQTGFDRDAFLATLSTAQTDLQAFMAVKQVVSYLTAAENTLLTRLPMYQTPVADAGIQRIAQDLPHPMQLLLRLVALSLVDVEQPVDTQQPEYQITPLVAEWLHNREELPLDLRQNAASYQQWIFDNLRKTLDQAIATHEALVYAGLQEEANEFALDWIVPHFMKIGRYQLLLDQWLPTILESEKLVIKARALNESGVAQNNLGNYDKALEYCQQSLEIFRGLGNRRNEGTTLNNISQIFKARGDYETALDYLKQSLKIQREIGNRSGEGTTLNNISQIFQARGDYETALDYLKQSLAIAKEIGDRNGEGTTLNNISQIFQARGDYETALDYLKQSLKIQKEIGDRRGEGITLNNISLIFKARGDYETALDYLKQSLLIRREIGDRSGEGTTLNNISQIFQARGDYETALDYLKQSLAIAKEIGDRRNEGGLLNNISLIFKARGDYETALDYLKQSLLIRREIGDVTGMCATLFNIGSTHWTKEEHQEAVAMWVQTYVIAKQIDLAEVLNNLDKLAKQLGGSGLAYWERLAQQRSEP
jgi:tetratricopeptide (TPR) repeat protein